MKIKIKSNLLLEGLEALATVIRDKHIIPILECVHVEFKKNKIYFTGTNVEISCVKELKFKSGLEVKFCIRYSLFLAMIKGIADQELSIEIEPTLIHVSHAKGKFKLPVFPTDEFVFSEQSKTDLTAVVNGIEFKESLKTASKFLSTDNIDVMSNVSISIERKKIIIRGTDRSSIFTEKIKGKGDKKQLLISSKSSLSLFNLISGKEITLEYNNSVVKVIDGNLKIIIVQQNGMFPAAQFDQIISTISGAEELVIDVTELKRSLRRISALSDVKYYNLVKFTLGIQCIEVSCNNKDSSTSGIETLEGSFPSIKEVGYNCKLLIEVLGVFNNEIKLGINDKNQFCFRSKNKKGLIGPVMLLN